MNTSHYKIIVFVPLTHTDVVRKAMGDAGAGVIGNYHYCSFSSIGIGRSFPLKGANPFIGEVGILEEIEEERIEMVCAKHKVKEVINAMRTVHPYDEVAFDIFQIIDDKEFD